MHFHSYEWNFIRVHAQAGPRRLHFHSYEWIFIGAPGSSAVRRQPRAATMSLTRSLASPKSMAVLSLKNSGFWTPA